MNDLEAEYSECDAFNDCFSMGIYHYPMPQPTYGCCIVVIYVPNEVDYWCIPPFKSVLPLSPLKSKSRCKSLLEILFPTLQEECNASYHRELHPVVKLEMDNSNENNITPSMLEVGRCKTTTSLLYLCFVIRW